MEKKYLTVGTDFITTDLFRPITNVNDSLKPIGALWLTEYDLNNPTYNEWVDFLLRHPHLLFYKSNSSNPWVKPCLLVTLKDDANIFKLESKLCFDYLKNNYSSKNFTIDYELLSKDYDGIEVNLKKLERELDLNEIKKFNKFGVSSLILFNLNVIDYYQSGVLNIEPFDYEGYFNVNNFYYDISIDLERKSVDSDLPQTNKCYKLTKKVV